MAKAKTVLSGLINLHSVSEHLPLTPQTLRRWSADGRFPRPVTVGDRRHWWRRDEVDAWLVDKGLPCLPPAQADRG